MNGVAESLRALDAAFRLVDELGRGKRSARTPPGTRDTARHDHDDANAQTSARVSSR